MGVQIDAINVKLDAIDIRVATLEKDIKECPLHVKESLAQFNDEVTKVFDSNFKIVQEIKDMQGSMDQILEWMKTHV